MPNKNPQPTKTRPDPIILKLFRLAFQLGGHLAPSLAGGIAYKLWLSPVRHKTPRSEKTALDTADLKYVQINNNRIATFSWGQSGPVVLLVHG